MVMATRPVYVSVRNFFCRGGPYTHYLNIEVQLNTCQRMVGIYGDVLEANVGNSYYLALVGLELHPFLYGLCAESGAGHLLNQ